MKRPVWLLIGQAVSSLLALVSAPVLARLIGVEGRGITASVTSLAYIVPILCAFGAPLAVRRRAAVETEVSQAAAIRWVVVASAVPSVCIAVACAYTVLNDVSGVVLLLSLGWIAASFITVWWMCDLAVLIARERFAVVMGMQIASPLALLLGAGIMWSTGTATVEGVLVTSIAGTMATLLIGRFGLANRFKKRTREPALTLLREGLPYYLGSAAEALSNRILLVVALPFLGATAAGLLSVGVTVAVVSLVLGQTLGSAYYPHVAQAEGLGLRSRALGELASVLVAVTPVGVLAAIFLVPVLFGDEFQRAVVPVAIMQVGAIPMVLGYCGALFLAATGRGVAASIAQLVGLGVQCLSIFLLRGFGAVGGAVAYTLGFSALALVALLLLRVNWLIMPSWAGLRGGLRTLTSGPRISAKAGLG